MKDLLVATAERAAQYREGLEMYERRFAVRTSSEVWALDVVTGATRQVGPSAHPHHLAWRDEQSVVVARPFFNASSKSWTWHLFESTTSGGDRKLRDLSADFPDHDSRGFFVGPDTYVLLTPSRVVVNPYGADIALPGAGARAGAPGNTADGAYLVLGVGADTAPVRALELIDVTKKTSVIVTLPFDARTTGYSRPALMPDHSAAIVLGRAGPNAPWGFYEVTFGTGRSRLVAQVAGDPRLYHFDLSPDGRRLVFTYDVTPGRR